MLHLLKMTLRGYVRHRFYTGLNLLSLIVGLFVAYTAIGYIRFEQGYDTFHQHADSVYRLANTYRSQDYSVIGFANWDAATAAEQQRQIDMFSHTTGVVAAAQFITSNVPTFVEGGGRKIQETNLLTTNTPAAFCSVFTWRLQQGSFQNFATGTNKLMLTARTARNLFGEGAADISQKRVKIGAEYYTVAAVIADVPLNSHVDFSMALSTPRIPYWGSRVYVQTEKGIDSETVTDNLNKAIAAFNPKLAADPLYKGHFLQPLTSIHLRSNLLYELKPPGNPRYLWLIGCFALCIGFVTLINYTNLTLAIKTKQSKSLGVQKAMGASVGAIAGQFVAEGVGLALLALPFVAGLVALLVPLFNRLMDADVPTNLLATPLVSVGVVWLAVGLGTLASGAAAVSLAGKNALALFNAALRSRQRQGIPVRKYLIVSQFVVVIGVASVAYFITKQLAYIDSKDLGFRKEGILYAYSSPDNQNVFQAKLRQLPGVKTVGNGSSFGIEPFNQTTYKLQDDATVFDNARQLYLDREALVAYGLKTTLGDLRAAGRSLPAVFTLINRTAAEQLAASKRVPVASLIGRTIITEPEYIDENRRVGFPFVVAGIFEDINVFSLHQKVEPYFITVSNTLRLDGRTIIRYDPATTAATLAGIRAVHTGLNEPMPLETEFLADNVARLYRQDRQMGTLLVCFMLIATLLAVVGTVGITVFLTVARMKEIGIRKVLGASVLSIVQSATKEYVVLVGVALLIGAPVAVYVVGQWLNGFAYHIDIQYVVFAGIGLLTLLIAAVVVGLIAYRAALMNPVKSLRSE